METKVSCCLHWRGKQKYQITNVGMKSNATKWTKLKIKYHNKFKTVLTNGNCKLFWGKTQTWNTHIAKIMSYQVFVHSCSAKGKWPSWLPRERTAGVRTCVTTASEPKITLCTIWDCLTSYLICIIARDSPYKSKWSLHRVYYVEMPDCRVVEL